MNGKTLHERLEEQEFRTFVSKFRPPLVPEFVPRKSKSEKYGQTGEDDCFQFEKKIGFLGKIKNYHVKVFFFEKGNLKGVTIQSFRELKDRRFV